MIIVVYMLAIFLSATLLFGVQPMFARMALPLLGGAPAVWNTALVFYQAALLAGYVYAHVTTRWLGVRRQAALHVIVLLLPLLVLPIGIPQGWTPTTTENPIPWLLALLLVAVGLPFWVVSASSPLLQKWFASTGHRSATDPYFLYAASNLGSMLALLSYPVLLEPYLRLHDQSRLWAVGYLLLVLLIGGCAVLLWRAPTRAVIDVPLSEAAVPGLTVSRRLRWIFLAFVPSSLMMSVTTYLSTDIAAVPLLWIIPLALYLLTFILVFASKPILPHLVMVRALPIVILPLLITLMIHATEPIGLLVVLHLLTFFVATMVCHGEMAQDRPPTNYLTEFYLWMSVGGVLGGIFNALIAPLVFSGVAEYPLTLVLVCLAGFRLTNTPQRSRERILDWALPAAVGLLTLGLVKGVQSTDLASGPLTYGLVFGLPAVICFGFSRRPLRFGLGVGAILLASTLYIGERGRALYTERSFFAVNRVALSPSQQYHLLLHGSTLHGIQSLEPSRRGQPLSYYFPDGPVDQVFSAFSGPEAKDSVAVVGLGAGSLACYGQPGQHWTFYEIDPSVERIARDPHYFTFLRDCPAKVVLGDARLSLAGVPDKQYDLIVLDAFSSDAIPMHLVTREALKLYLDKLAADGLLLFNISNRHFDMEPTFGNLAQDAGVVSLVQSDDVRSQAELDQGKQPSQWVVMGRQSAHLGKLVASPRWRPVRVQPNTAVWTDDFSSILSVLKTP